MEDIVEQGQLISKANRKPRKRQPPSKKANDLDGKAWMRNSISIWSDISKTPEEIATRHPAMFPARLATRLLESFTKSDQTVILDPFSGIGLDGPGSRGDGETGDRAGHIRRLYRKS